ncbi:MAG: sugar phosphate isomerase/epimerase [Verrucomicrobia bacterium]|nr:MAG: sugar phosphate isomerase/epimerase [Verrucomicrobiota bacterium]PYK01666.1 MAG: sugar phosphate isomerase/epimerase [Verrucomicrobiota bacterium]
MQTTTRRNFLKCTLRAGAAFAGASLLDTGSLLAVEPIKRTGAPRLLLSLAGYSFRDYFKDANHKRDARLDPSKQIDLFQFIDYCAEHGCQGTELTSYYFPPDLDHDFLIRIKRHAFLRGIDISGTAVGNTFTVPAGPKRDQEIASTKKWIDYAAIMGAPHIRIFAGAAPSGMSLDEARQLCIPAIEECCDYAGGKGIFLGLENHGGIVSTAEEILEIVRAVKSPWLGINLDTGNFRTDDPYADLVKIAPYAVNVQMKGEVHPHGKGEERADLPRLVKILRDAGYQGYVALEYESKEDPWTAVPRLLKQMKELFAALR